MKTTLALICAFITIVMSIDSQVIPSRHPQERDGNAKVIHRADVVRDQDAPTGSPMRLWPLYSSPESRMNYVEVSGRSSWHFHPDADHKLYVLEGNVLVYAGTNRTSATVGDLIIIPKGVRHCYDCVT